MTQEDKDLLLKDLCARLPYGVKGINENAIISSPKDWKTEYTLEFAFLYRIEKYKWRPYLFPLSSITEEQKVEFEKMSELDYEYVITQIKNDSPNWTSGFNRINWLLKNHFDIYGLIPMGLAINATGLNIY